MLRVVTTQQLLTTRMVPLTANGTPSCGEQQKHPITNSPQGTKNTGFTAGGLANGSVRNRKGVIPTRTGWVFSCVWIALSCSIDLSEEKGNLSHGLTNNHLWVRHDPDALLEFELR
jgi:hypothetical protein